MGPRSLGWQLTGLRNAECTCHLPLAAAVAAAHPGNPLLQMRGNAGSHDMALGTDTLHALRGATTPGSTVPLPRCLDAVAGRQAGHWGTGMFSCLPLPVISSCAGRFTSRAGAQIRPPCPRLPHACMQV